MAITTRAFGTTQDGQNVTMYTLTNQSGASVSMLDLGAIVTNILVSDKSGKLADVALGFDTLAHYEGGHGAMGDTIGRFANRIGGGCFTLDGTEYHLYQNDGENTLHGGTAKWTKRAASSDKRPCMAAKSASRRRSGRRRPSRGIRWIPSSSTTFPPIWRRTSPAI